MSLPYALMPVPRQRFVDLDGHPYALGSLSFFEAGSDTPKSVYADAAAVTSLTAVVTLDAYGVAPAIFLDRGGYKVVLADADGGWVWTEDGVEDVAGTFFNRIGAEWLAGESVTADYAIVETDRFVPVTASAPVTLSLPLASNHLSPLCVKNLGSAAVTLVCSGANTLEGTADPYVIPFGAYPLYPTVWLMADGVSSWWVMASHGGEATSLM